MHIIPNSNGEDNSPLREFNSCHAPGGTPVGGQFCTGAGVSGVVAGDAAKFAALKTRWAQLNADLLKIISPQGSGRDSPEAKAKLAEQMAVSKAMYRLRADPGGLEGEGLPGGHRDVVIIGAGPGGLAAAMMAGQGGLDALVIDASASVGGQAKFSSRVENYPGFPAGITGHDIATQMSEQVQRSRVELLLGVRVTGISYDEASGVKTLTLSNGKTETARSVIIAGGVELKKLTVPGANDANVITGDGERLAKEGTGKTVAVIGGSNGAAQAVHGAATTAAHVVLVAKHPLAEVMDEAQVLGLRNNPKVRVIEGAEVAAWDPRTSSLKLSDGETVRTQKVGVFIGGMPKTDWLPAGIKRDAQGKVLASLDGNVATSMPGVFAVGDVRSGNIGRIGAAVGEGQLAMFGVHGYFKTLRKTVTH